jgi:hypothetical protein
MLLIIDLLVFAVYYFLPQVQTIESPILRSALELEGFGALVSSSHPLMVNSAICLRLLFAGLLFFGFSIGRYLLATSILWSIVATAAGGLVVLTNVDMLSLTALYLLDGYLFAQSRDFSAKS